MTDREKAIVSAYTGYAMLTGNKLSVFYAYIEEILGRPIMTHELALKSVQNEIYWKSKPDFVALCADEERGTEQPEQKRGKWIVIMNEPNITFDECKCSECGVIEYFNKGWKKFSFCPNCGARMEESE